MKNLKRGQSRAELRAEEADRLEHGWMRIKVPLPFSLRWVNSYLIPEEKGYTVIDPGLRTDEAVRTWEAVLEREGIAWKDISRIILTHQHPDHYGLSGYLQKLSGAPVYMTRESHAYTQRLWKDGDAFARELMSLYSSHGMPGYLIEAVGEHLGSFVAKVSPQPEVSYIAPGDTMAIGGVLWQLIDAPGHASGQLCFYSRERRWMLCGDQVLPRITPNVSIVPGEEEDPLASFLASLEHLRGYDVHLALPGHRDPFPDFAGRIDELRQHHARRLERMRELIEEKPRTAFGMCEALFGESLRGNAHNLRFAMSETLAHLVYLERRGLLRRKDEGGVIVYCTTGRT
ncbi:MBL fold metallo-hydrolase [Paenibacillus sp. N4]|uniref:MBL fold metallo-hydrolase n=1 Tax=Paenibacillus vietnamensis TaxID=2590547 RepID=UPI001CD0A6E2|nr:MBL fold metallo-hydrolase [Paenibacillus vietnamensis]MCA0755312.1 MBL fold metallo-hydrolase [Paenibacillus vietnamensis]